MPSPRRNRSPPRQRGIRYSPEKNTASGRAAGDSPQVPPYRSPGRREDDEDENSSSQDETDDAQLFENSNTSSLGTDGSPYSSLRHYVEECDEVYYGPGYRKESSSSSVTHESFETKSYVQSGQNFVRPPLRPAGQRSSPHKPGSKQADNNYLVWIAVVAVIIILALLLAVFLNWSGGESAVIIADESQDVRQNYVNSFDEQFAVLRSKFPRQKERFWKMLRASTKPILATANPRSPATLIIAGKTGDAFATALCIAKKFSELVSNAYGAKQVLTVGKTEIELYTRNSDSSGLKLYLDQHMRRHFENDNRAFLLENMQLVPGKAMEIYHGYCDNDNAPFKDVSIVFVLELPGDLSQATESDVEYFLEDIWAQELENNVYSSLSTRVSNNIAIATEADSETLRAHCT